MNEIQILEMFDTIKGKQHAIFTSKGQLKKTYVNAT